MVNNDDDDDIGVLTELPNFSHKSEFSKARLVETFISKVCDSRSREMREGYYNWKLDKNGNALKVWVEDARKIYCSSVDALIALLIPEIMSNEIALEAVSKFNELKEKLFKKFAYQPRRKIKKFSSIAWESYGELYMPRIDDELPTDNPQHKLSEEMVMNKGYWNDKVNLYWDELVVLYDQIFSELNRLIGSKEINYFKPKSGF